jgi:predicted dehydrogenase
MTSIAVVGYGYWGPNLARNFSKLEDCRLAAVVDMSVSRLDKVRRLYPAVRTTSSYEEILNDRDIHAVVIATPVCSHYPLARQAIQAGKHVLVEKPMTTTVAEAEELILLARRQGVVLMVDHTFVYTGAVRKIRQVIDSGEMGQIYYYDSVRVNLGLFQPDVSVLWDLAPHDFSIMTYLIDKEPVRVSAVGASPVSWDGWNQESVVYVTVEFNDSTLAHFHVNWLSPVKVRRTLIGGSKKMVIYDHLDPDNQIKIFDKGVDVHNGNGTTNSRYQALVQYRTGDLLVPKIDQTEALEVLSRHFVESIREGRQPLTDGEAGLRVVRLLELAEGSIRNGRMTQPWLSEESPRHINPSPTM